MRVVSLVPSLTDTVASLGAASTLVGVTRYCTDGAPADAERIGGTKNPDVQRVVALRPDLVLANTEENRPDDLQRLRDAGLTVEETYPRSVAQAARMVRRLGEVLDRAEQAAPLADAIDEALAAVSWPADRPRVMALTLVWRKPWMGLGPQTYADDLLWQAGFANVLSGFEDPYPTLDPSFVLGPDVVLLPSEPYAFADSDLEAVGGLVGPQVPTRFVDGQALTWHGPRSAAALLELHGLARTLDVELQTSS